MDNDQPVPCCKKCGSTNLVQADPRVYGRDRVNCGDCGAYHKWGRLDEKSWRIRALEYLRTLQTPEAVQLVKEFRGIP